MSVTIYKTSVSVSLMSEKDKNMVQNAVEPKENDENNLKNGDDEMVEVEQVNEQGRVVNIDSF